MSSLSSCGRVDGSFEILIPKDNLIFRYFRPVLVQFLIKAIIIHSKYFPIFDVLKPHAFGKNLVLFNQRCQKCSLQQIIELTTSKVRLAAGYWKPLNRWRRKPADEVVLFLVSRKIKSTFSPLNTERSYITRLRCSACQSQIPTDDQCSHLIGLFTQV